MSPSPPPRGKYQRNQVLWGLRQVPPDRSQVVDRKAQDASYIALKTDILVVDGSNKGIPVDGLEAGQVPEAGHVVEEPCHVGSCNSLLVVVVVVRVGQARALEGEPEELLPGGLVTDAREQEIGLDGVGVVAGQRLEQTR